MTRTLDEPSPFVLPLCRALNFVPLLDVPYSCTTTSSTCTATLFFLPQEALNPIIPLCQCHCCSPHPISIIFPFPCRLTSPVSDKLLWESSSDMLGLIPVKFSIYLSVYLSGMERCCLFCGITVDKKSPYHCGRMLTLTYTVLVVGLKSGNILISSVSRNKKG